MSRGRLAWLHRRSLGQMAWTFIMRLALACPCSAANGFVGIRLLGEEIERIAEHADSLCVKPPLWGIEAADATEQRPGEAPGFAFRSFERMVPHQCVGGWTAICLVKWLLLLKVLFYDSPYER